MREELGNAFCNFQPFIRVFCPLRNYTRITGWDGRSRFWALCWVTGSSAATRKCAIQSCHSPLVPPSHFDIVAVTKRSGIFYSRPELSPLSFAFWNFHYKIFCPNRILGYEDRSRFWALYCITGSSAATRKCAIQSCYSPLLFLLRIWTSLKWRGVELSIRGQSYHRCALRDAAALSLKIPLACLLLRNVHEMHACNYSITLFILKSLTHTCPDLTLPAFNLFGTSWWE